VARRQQTRGASATSARRLPGKGLLTQYGKTENRPSGVVVNGADDRNVVEPGAHIHLALAPPGRVVSDRDGGIARSSAVNARGSEGGRH
jgi:hypothetical protein